MNVDMNAEYPRSEIRLQFLDKNTTGETRPLVQRGMHFILRKVDAYLYKNCALRDEAIELIKAGKTQEAVEVLKRIGE